MDFREALDKRVIIGDGAMGTRILEEGIEPGLSTASLNLSRPRLVRRLHGEYVEAGAELLETNTLTANRESVGHRVREINLAGARIAREAAGKNVFVGGSVGPADSYEDQIAALAEGGVDVIILETFMKLDDLRVALEAVREHADLPVVCLMASAVPEGIDADIVGVNCMETEKAVRLVEESGCRAAFPSGGSPEEFAQAGARLIAAGARLVGGCCGTGPDHIRALKAKLK